MTVLTFTKYDGSNTMKVLPRHQIVVHVADPPARLLARILYGYEAEPYDSGDRPCLVLSNHVSMLDPIFVGLSFRFPLYYVAADDVFKKKFWSRLLVWLISPIPKTKGVSDLTTIREMVSAVKQGGAFAFSQTAIQPTQVMNSIL